MGLADLTQPARAAQPAAVHQAAAALRDGQAYAAIPAFSDTHAFGPLKGRTDGLSPGDSILVAFDESGDPWCIGRPAGHLDLSEQAVAPPAPPADGVRLYAIDNGAGKTRLMARFATGNAVEIIIQP